MSELFGQSHSEKRIHLESMVSWSFFSKPDGKASLGTLVTLSGRHALLETMAPIPEGRWVRLRLTVDRSFELLIVGRVARSTFKPGAHSHFQEVDLTHPVNPVVLALLELRQRMLAKFHPEHSRRLVPSPTPA